MARAEPRVEVAAPPQRLARLVPDPQLDRFRPPASQLAALVDIAADPHGTVTALVADERLLGYAAFHPPSAIEAWGHDRTGELIELGAVEVAPALRGRGWAERLLTESFAGGRFDPTVVFATLYAWHYDLRRSGLTDVAYRRMLERLYRSAGLELYPTSDEDVRSSPANALMARVGPQAPPEVVEEFHRLRRAAPGAPHVAW